MQNFFWVVYVWNFYTCFSFNSKLDINEVDLKYGSILKE